MKKNRIYFQINTIIPQKISKKKFLNWINQTIKKKYQITIRIVDQSEIQKINYTYRKKNYPTNILSFSYNHQSYNNNIIGDLVICAKVVYEEALNQKKKLENYWAHIVIHGLLHLLGYTHYTNYQTQIMQKKEIEIMKKLGYQNPYSK
ncbi:rRNA maturation RNase YbeY [Buchnera aphidicola]|uniref:rRNA maturation RNase YbeY n=1 Tax=Buchnera aphidicola TaxID=9 RepID=UPI0031B81E4E